MTTAALGILVNQCRKNSRRAFHRSHTRPKLITDDFLALGYVNNILIMNSTIALVNVAPAIRASRETLITIAIHLFISRPSSLIGGDKMFLIIHIESANNAAARIMASGKSFTLFHESCQAVPF